MLENCLQLEAQCRELREKLDPLEERRKYLQGIADDFACGVPASGPELDEFTRRCAALAREVVQLCDNRSAMSERMTGDMCIFGTNPNARDPISRAMLQIYARIL